MQDALAKLDKASIELVSTISSKDCANKRKNIRAALCYSAKNTQLSRLHNNANIITLGSRLIDKRKAFNLIKIFLNTKFEGGRHLKRIRKI